MIATLTQAPVPVSSKAPGLVVEQPEGVHQFGRAGVALGADSFEGLDDI